MQLLVGWDCLTSLGGLGDPAWSMEIFHQSSLMLTFCCTETGEMDSCSQI